MADTGGEAGFQVVKTRRNKKNKRTQRCSKELQRGSGDVSSEHVDQEGIIQRIHQCRADIIVSDFMVDIQAILTHIRNHLKQIDQNGVEVSEDSARGEMGKCPEDCPEGPVLKTLVCYGMGNFTSCPIARYQLALLLILRDETKVQNVSCHVYDPVFTKPEKEILQKLNLNVLQINEEGKRVVDGPTLFYMPHCGRPLYNNLLWANWDPTRLGQLMVLGNSLTDMTNRTPDRVLHKQTPFIHDILPFLREYPLKNSFRFNDIFNDTSLQVFCDRDLQKAEQGFWSKQPEPIYDKDDLEIITKSR